MAVIGIQLVDPVKAGPGRHIDLTADDGLDPLLPAGSVEVHAAVHDAVVRDRHCRLAQFLDPPHQIPDAAGAVQQGKLRMHVEMDKGHRFRPPFS